MSRSIPRTFAPTVKFNQVIIILLVLLHFKLTFAIGFDEVLKLKILFHRDVYLLFNLNIIRKGMKNVHFVKNIILRFIRIHISIIIPLPVSRECF